MHRLESVVFVFALLGPPAGAQLAVQDLNHGIGPQDLVAALAGEGGSSVSNIIYTGAPLGAGLFSGGGVAVGFDAGVILCSGNVNNARGPNTSDSRFTVFGTPGDPDLAQLVPGFATHDAAVLQFDFECEIAQVITLSFVFGSEEYNEHVFEDFNDAFGFFLNGENVAFLPDGVTPVSISTVNGGNPFGSGNAVNSQFFRNNDITDGGGTLNVQYDGLTVVLNVATAIQPGLNHLKFAIADVGDSFLDSAVFLQAGTFACGANRDPVCGVDLSAARLEFLEPSPGSFVVTEGANFTAVFTGTDEDGDALTASLSGVPGASLSTALVQGGLQAVLSWTPSPAHKVGAPYTASVTFTDPHGAVATCSVEIDDVNLRPDCSATPGSGGTLAFECTGPTGAAVTLLGVATDPDDGVAALMYHWDVSDLDVVLDDDDIQSPTGTFPEGNTMATLTVADGRGGIAICDVLVQVVDATPPELSCSSDLASLWPPNHALRAVTFYVIAMDTCENPGEVSLTIYAASDEPDDAQGNGDGETEGDVDGLDAYATPIDVTHRFVFDPLIGANGAWVGTLNLRAERAGSEDGRKYTISVDASDSSGNMASASCCVIVPHDRRGGAH